MLWLKSQREDSKSRTSKGLMPQLRQTSLMSPCRSSIRNSRHLISRMGKNCKERRGGSRTSHRVREALRQLRRARQRVSMKEGGDRKSRQKVQKGRQTGMEKKENSKRVEESLPLQQSMQTGTHQLQEKGRIIKL